MNKYIFLLLLGLLLLNWGCEEHSTYVRSRAPRDKPKRAEQIILFRDTIPVNERAPLRVIAIGIDRDIITIDLAYNGGCQVHNIHLYGYPKFFESSPPQVNVYIGHDDNDDQCDGIIYKTMQFDLSPLKEIYWKYYGYHPGKFLLQIYEPLQRKPLTPFFIYTF